MYNQVPGQTFNFGQFQLPQLYEMLQGTPQAESMDLSNIYNDEFRKRKFWNDYNSVGLGQMNMMNKPQYQMQDPFSGMFNDYTGTQFY